MNSLRSQLETRFPDLPFKWNFPLAELTYFKIGGPAEAYLELSNKEQIIVCIAFCRENNIELTLFGGASNLLVADQGVPGLVLRLTNDHVEVEDTKLIAGAGIKTSLLVRKSLDHNLTGLEYFLGVPGNLGGAIFNNAHYLHHLIGEYITRVEVLGEDNNITWLSQEECDFQYDYSRFHTTNEVILSAEFKLKPGTKEASEALIKEATIRRATTQPLGLPSSGCIFQNVPITPELAKRFPQFSSATHIGGGFLIDQAGLKGLKEGDVEVSDKHAAFFVNKGKGTAAQTVLLMEKVRQKVKEQFGVTLQPEIFFLGMKNPFFKTKQQHKEEKHDY